MQEKRHVKKGDTVHVISGKEKGKQGKILKVLYKEDRVLVEGVNEVKRHTKPQQGQPGGIVTKNAPIHISNVLPIDPESGKPTRVARKVVEGKGGAKRVRVSTRSGAQLK